MTLRRERRGPLADAVEEGPEGAGLLMGVPTLEVQGLLPGETASKGSPPGHNTKITGNYG